MVEAKKLGLDLKEVTESVELHWNRLNGAGKLTRKTE